MAAWRERAKSKWRGATALALLGFGCGGEVANPDPEPREGAVPDDMPLAALSDGQLAALCAERDDFYETSGVWSAIDEYWCRQSGISAASEARYTEDEGTRAACRWGYDRCVANPRPRKLPSCTRPTASCIGNAGDLRACVHDIPPWVTTLVDGVPACNVLTLAYVGAPHPSAAGFPTSCEHFDDLCPGGIGDGYPEPSTGVSQ